MQSGHEARLREYLAGEGAGRRQRLFAHILSGAIKASPRVTIPREPRIALYLFFDHADSKTYS
jgi:hypothetical protein